jgi:hypothetical protein
MIEINVLKFGRYILYRVSVLYTTNDSFEKVYGRRLDIHVRELVVILDRCDPN